MTLNDALGELRKIEFPEFAEDDQLSDWMVEMADMDGYVAGIAVSALAGHKEAYPNLKRSLAELRNRLETITKFPEEDKPIYESCMEYLNAMDRIVGFIDC